VLGDIPASWVAERFGDRRSMMMAAVLAVFSFLACTLARSLIVLDSALTVLGMTSSTFYLARQSYLMDVAPLRLWARAQSTLAGAHRIGLFIGPFLAAAAIGLDGVRGVYLVAMLTGLITAVILIVVSDVEAQGQSRATDAVRVSAVRVLRGHHRLFLTLGFAIAAVGAVRQARQSVLPLWAQHIGLSPTQTSVMFGIANAVDMVMFYPSGKVMDR
jgi:MFS family permease